MNIKSLLLGSAAALALCSAASAAPVDTVIAPAKPSCTPQALAISDEIGMITSDDIGFSPHMASTPGPKFGPQLASAPGPKIGPMTRKPNIPAPALGGDAVS